MAATDPREPRAEGALEAAARAVVELYAGTMPALEPPSVAEVVEIMRRHGLRGPEPERVRAPVSEWWAPATASLPTTQEERP